MCDSRTETIWIYQPLSIYIRVTYCVISFMSRFLLYLFYYRLQKLQRDPRTSLRRFRLLALKQGLRRDQSHRWGYQSQCRVLLQPIRRERWDRLIRPRRRIHLTAQRGEDPSVLSRLKVLHFLQWRGVTHPPLLSHRYRRFPLQSPRPCWRWVLPWSIYKKLLLLKVMFVTIQALF